MINIIKKALSFAEKAHKRQERKYTGSPYIVHPIRVTLLVNSVTCDDNMLTAAVLHDVVEDTKVSFSEISKVFNQDVAYLVEGLTDISVPEDGNRKKRKEIDRIHISEFCGRVKTIKLADVIDNSKSVILYDAEFAKIYIPEKKLLLEVLKEGDPGLFQIASDIITEYFLRAEQTILPDIGEKVLADERGG